MPHPREAGQLPGLRPSPGAVAVRRGRNASALQREIQGRGLRAAQEASELQQAIRQLGTPLALLQPSIGRGPTLLNLQHLQRFLQVGEGRSSGSPVGLQLQVGIQIIHAIAQCGVLAGPVADLSGEAAASGRAEPAVSGRAEPAARGRASTSA